MDVLSAAVLMIAAFVGWSIGANSASNVAGMLVGPNIASYRSAIFLVASLMTAGALLQSGAVANTIEEGIMAKNLLEDYPLLPFSALVGSVFLIYVLSCSGLPASASHAIVGSMVGAAVSAGLAGELNYITISWIVFSWFMTPVLAICLSYFIYRTVLQPMSKRMSLVSYSMSFKVLTVLSAALVAYGLGANNAGNVVGIVLGAGFLKTDKFFVSLFVVASMCFGMLLFGRNVVKTVSRNITLIDPVTAFSAQLSAGVVIYFYTLVGVPISITQALLGGLIGVGFTKGSGLINKQVVLELFIGWITTPVAAGLVAMVVYYIFSRLVFFL